MLHLRELVKYTLQLCLQQKQTSSMIQTNKQTLANVEEGLTDTVAFLKSLSLIEAVVLR